MSYKVNGSTIKSCEEECDLGVSLDCDLTCQCMFKTNFVALRWRLSIIVLLPMVLGAHTLLA